MCPLPLVGRDDPDLLGPHTTLQQLGHNLLHIGRLGPGEEEAAAIFTWWGGGGGGGGTTTKSTSSAYYVHVWWRGKLQDQRSVPTKGTVYMGSVLSPNYGVTPQPLTTTL